MPAFVIDASATLPWCFADEATPATNALLTWLKNGDEPVVPEHWPVEASNALLAAGRRQRISAEDARQFMEYLEALPIRIEPESGKLFRPGVSSLAEQHRLTIYDAAYLELALLLNLPLATLDADWQRAFRTAGSPLI